MKILEAGDISYTYPNGAVAIDGVSIEISRGESIAIVGPNGGGKSTLLLVLSLLLRPQKGEIVFMGEKIDRNKFEKEKYMKRFRRKIGIVFQEPDVQLFSSTVYNDIAFAPSHFRWDEEKIREEVNKVMDRIGIKHLAERHPYELSGGEKRLATIASVMVYSPDIIFLDEPTSNLDYDSKELVMDIIKEMKKEGKTVVVATHDIEIVPEVAERLVILNKKIFKDKPMDEISPEDLSIVWGKKAMHLFNFLMEHRHKN